MAITACSTRKDAPNTISFPGIDNHRTGRRDDNNNNYNNNNSARARTRESLLEHEAQKASSKANQTILHGDFAQTYEDALGRPMPAIVAREIQGMLSKGISGTLIHTVLEYTAGAPRPSWAYARAVILRSYAKGINDDEAFLDALGG